MDNNTPMFEVKVYAPTQQNPKFSARVIYVGSNRESFYENCESAQEALFQCYYELVCGKVTPQDAPNIKVPAFPNEVKIMSEAEIENIVIQKPRLTKITGGEEKDVLHFTKVPADKSKLDELVKFSKLKDDGYIISDIPYRRHLLGTVIDLIKAVFEEKKKKK